MAEHIYTPTTTIQAMLACDEDHIFIDFDRDLLSLRLSLD
jgi:hypothetical protein